MKITRVETWKESVPLSRQHDLIRLLGADVWAVTLYTKGLTPDEARTERARLTDTLGIPVVLPLEDGVDELVDVIRERIAVNQ